MTHTFHTPIEGRRERASWVARRQGKTELLVNSMTNLELDRVASLLLPDCQLVEGVREKFAAIVRDYYADRKAVTSAESEYRNDESDVLLAEEPDTNLDNEADTDTE